MAAKKNTGRSADAVEGAAAAKRATRAKRTGINATNAMDAISRARREYIPQNARAGSVNPTAAKRREIMSQQPAGKAKPTTRRTGPSADAKAGSIASKKATAKARATGQTTQSAMDAVSRRYKNEASLYKDLSGDTRLLKMVRDNVTGYLLSGKRGVNLYGPTLIKPATKKAKAKKR